MIYLDYSATTPVEEQVLESYVKACKNFIGNPNSLHRLGVEANTLIEDATKQVASLLKVKPSEVIYTSGSSESNNTAIKGIAFKYQNRGKHIIATELEHSSVIAPLQYLTNLGFEVDFVKLNAIGEIDLEHLKSLLREDTILVTMASVSSEIGILQPIEEVGKLLKSYPKCLFHVDMTQSIGKVNISLENIDLISLSAHKFYGMKGIGVLIKKEGISFDPLIHGGKSTTVYRSGTPALPLIVSLSKALRLSLENLEEKQEEVKRLNFYLREELNKIEGIHINSSNCAIPHILNFSVPGIRPETLQHALEEKNIFISTQTACSKGGSPSTAVMAVTHNEDYAVSSLRVSISHKTTKHELSLFVETLKEVLERLKFTHERIEKNSRS
ncbi:MAG: cysteine desulfurase [Bacilli bacterium]|nr:cysteine desulfurase [Bacilli bacterium]